VIDLAGGTEQPDAAQAAAHLVGEAVTARDGYAARDILAHDGCRARLAGAATATPASPEALRDRMTKRHRPHAVHVMQGRRALVHLLPWPLTRWAPEGNAAPAASCEGM